MTIIKSKEKPKQPIQPSTRIELDKEYKRQIDYLSRAAKSKGR
jgi:hypothetical protein